MPENKQYHYDDKNEPLTTMHAVSQGIAMPVRHLHSQYEFYYVRSGRVAIENNADSLVVEAPCFVIHKPFSLHRVNADFGNKYDRYVINCSKENLDKIIPLVIRDFKNGEQISTQILIRDRGELGRGG